MTIWTILVATLGRRSESMRALMDGLLPQVDAAGGEVTVEALWNNGERPVGEVRQALLEHATSQYVCFADDDDELPPHYVRTILPLLDGTDYVGFKVDVAGAVVEHGLHVAGWDAGLGSRDITHLNPLKRSLAVQSSFSGGRGEDRRWAAGVRRLVHTGHFVDEVMYFYRPSGLAADDPVIVRMIHQMSGAHGSGPWQPAGALMTVSRDDAAILCRTGDHGGAPIAEWVGTALAVSDSGRYTRPAFPSPWFSWHPGSSEDQ